MKPINHDNIDAIQATRHRREQLARSLAILDEKQFWLCESPLDRLFPCLGEGKSKPAPICFGDPRKASEAHPDVMALQVLSEKLDADMRSMLRAQLQAMIRQLDIALADFGMVVK